MVQQCAAQIINSDLPGMQTAGQAPVKPMRWAALLGLPDVCRPAGCTCAAAWQDSAVSEFGVVACSLQRLSVTHHSSSASLEQAGTVTAELQASVSCTAPACLTRFVCCAAGALCSG